MSVINTQPLIGSSGQATGYNLERSLRFRSSASANLSRTPSSAGNRRTFTWSGWIKRGILGGGKGIFEAVGSGGLAGKGTFLNWGSDNLLIQLYDNTYNTVWNTGAVFRDPSAWYHVIFAIDTTQASQTNRVKIYVNGVQQSLTVTHYSATLPQNYDTFINDTVQHNINTYVSASHGDQYYAEVNFVDGQQLDASPFGETDTITGVWKPKRYAGTYGTNGFYLKFNNLTSTSTLGNDSSGNGHTWTVNNVSLTAGATYDSMTDVPTLTSATAANFATWNPVVPASQTLSNGNLQLSTASSAAAPATVFPKSGKWYAEIALVSGTNHRVGVCNLSGVAQDLGGNANTWAYLSDARVYNNGSTTSYGVTATNGDIINVALDLDNGRVWYGKNGTWMASGNPATNTSPSQSFTANQDMSFAVASGTGTIVYTGNFGQQPFTYTPPSGFVALNTYNLPDSTIVAGNAYMDATTYTGDGATSARSITNAGVFQPDFVWLKERDVSLAHTLYDNVRGVGSGKRLASNDTVGEGGNDNATYGYVSAINSNGFSVIRGSDGTISYTNKNNGTYVAWQWKANGTGATNTSGSITSTVSVNASAGFSIVTYTGTGVSNATVGHGLGVAPKMVILKSRSTNSTSNNWWVNHASLSSGNNLYLNTGDAQFAVSGTTSGGLGTLSSTTFTLANGSSTNNNTNQSGGTFVAYCWSEIAGFSSFGSYTGNGSTDGPFIYTGFRPKFILTKRRDATSDWWIQDTARSPRNASNALLFPNLANAEYTTAGVEFDILSNGFKPRNTGHNISGGTYIYMAFAEVPFKNSLGR
jgi:hypothetical protein